MRKYSNNNASQEKNNHIPENQNNKNTINKSVINQDNNFERDDNEELEDKFYYDIPIKDFKKKNQFKESGNYFTLNKNRDPEMTPQNQTQNNINHFYQNNINNTNTNSNKSNYYTNNQFNFSKNTNMNLNSNFHNNLNNLNNTNLNNEVNKDKNKREIIEEILRDTSSGSFFAKIDRERPFTPPFTKLVPMNSFEKMNSSVFENKDNNMNLNSSKMINAEIFSSKIENNLNNNNNLINPNSLLNSKNTFYMNSNVNFNNSVNLNSNNININNSKFEDIGNLNGKMNINQSNLHDISYKIKDINYNDLIYDHVMGHYYDPKTNIYYELKNIGNANKTE